MKRLSPLKLLVLVSILGLPAIYLSVSNANFADPLCEKKSISVTSKGLSGAITHLSQSQDSQIYKDGCGNHLAIMSSQLNTPRFNPTALAASYGVSLLGNTVSAVPILHSNQGASRKIYLKFDSYTFPQNSADSSWWGFFSGLAQPGATVPGLDLDGNPSTFSAFEQAYITETWLAVAEDFSVFDIDVTTENPGEAGLTKATLNDTTFGLTAAISSAADWSAKCGQYGCGGVAYVASINVLPSVVGANLNPMGVVFAFNKFNNDFNYHTTAKDLAGIVSHELGHGIGLMHDGTTRASSNEEYFPGHQNGLWAPIMGTSYNQAINHWSKNEYANGVARSNPIQDGSQLYVDPISGWGWYWIVSQDDYEVAEANNLPIRTDDYGNNISSSTNLTGERQLKSGIVGPNSDIDFFRFTINATQQVSIAANPIDKSPDLDILMKL